MQSTDAHPNFAWIIRVDTDAPTQALYGTDRQSTTLLPIGGDPANAAIFTANGGVALESEAGL